MTKADDGLTYTYKDNPFPDGTKERLIWHSAFVHGLDTATKGMSHMIGNVRAVIDEAFRVIEGKK